MKGLLKRLAAMKCAILCCLSLWGGCQVEPNESVFDESFDKEGTPADYSVALGNLQGPGWQQAEVAFGGFYHPGRLINTPDGTKFQAGIFTSGKFLPGIFLRNLGASEGSVNFSFIPCLLSDNWIDYGILRDEERFVPALTFTDVNGDFVTLTGWAQPYNEGTLRFIKGLSERKISKYNYGILIPGTEAPRQPIDRFTPPPSRPGSTRPSRVVEKEKSLGRKALSAAGTGLGAFVACELGAALVGCFQGLPVGGLFGCLGYGLAVGASQLSTCSAAGVITATVVPVMDHYGEKLDKTLDALLEEKAEVEAGRRTGSSGGGSGDPRPTPPAGPPGTFSIGGCGYFCGSGRTPNVTSSNDDLYYEYSGSGGSGGGGTNLYLIYRVR